MNPQALREIVLVKAIEDADRAGEVISRKERDRATRLARESNGLPETGPIDTISDELLAKVMADRATVLAGPVIAKNEAIQAAFVGSSWPALLLLAIVPLALASGYGIRWLSGFDRVNFMSAPIWLLVAWNLIVYMALVVWWLLTLRQKQPKHHFWRDLAGRVINRRLAPIVSQTSRSDFVISEALARFAAIWNIAHGAVIAQRLRQVAHVGGAMVGLGLIAALFYRYWDTSFLGGWDSSFGTSSVKVLADLFLKPFSRLTDAAFPETITAFDALKFGSPSYVPTAASPWLAMLMYLVAAVVVLPRLALTALASLRIGRIAQTAALPESLIVDARATIGVRGHYKKMCIAVFPYDVAMTWRLEKRLQNSIRRHFGDGATTRIHGSVTVGHEKLIEKLISEAAKDSDGLVIFTSIQAEPEDKWHGVLLGAAHDRMLSPALGIDLKVLVDDHWPTPWYLPTKAQRWRRSQRKRQWRTFSKRYRVPVSFMPPDELPLGDSTPNNI